MATLGNVPRPGYVYDTETDTWVPIGVGAHTHAYIPNTLVDAKGDILTATADNVPARLAKGADGTVLVSDSTTQTGLAWQPYAAQFVSGKNKIINGDFGIWQRGTSFTPGLGNWTTDRFAMYTEGSGATRTVSRQAFTLGSAPVSGYEGQYFFRYAQTVGPSANIGNNLIMHRIEGVRTLAGQTVTFSFWAKAAATTVLDGAYVYQVFGTGGSPSANVQTWFGQNISIGTSWTRYSYTITIPSIAGKTIGTNNDDFLDIRIGLPLTSGATFTFDTWGWQLEAGSVATPFTTATGNIASELAACQRYYVRLGGDSSYGVIGTGIMGSTTEASFVVPLPVTMRVAPTSIDFSTLRVTDFIAVNSPISSMSLTTSETTKFSARLYSSGLSGLTQYRPAFISNYNSSSGYLGFSAEL